MGWAGTQPRPRSLPSHPKESRDTPKETHDTPRESRDTPSHLGAPFLGCTSPARSQPSALGQKPLKGVPITPHILPWLCPPLTAPAPTQRSVLGPWVMG